MARRASRLTVPDEYPVLLRRLVTAAEVECPPGHAQVLTMLTALALCKVPSRGIFDPGARNEPDLFAAIESAARTHLHLGTARAHWRTALDAAELSLERRDDIESAATEVQSVSDTAYFYAGLAFGLTFVGLQHEG